MKITAVMLKKACSKPLSVGGISPASLRRSMASAVPSGMPSSDVEEVPPVNGDVTRRPTNGLLPSQPLERKKKVLSDFMPRPHERTVPGATTDVVTQKTYPMWLGEDTKRRRYYPEENLRRTADSLGRCAWFSVSLGSIGRWVGGSVVSVSSRTLHSSVLKFVPGCTCS